MRVLIIGCGYVGITLGGLLARRGHTVAGLRRSVAADTELRANGIIPIHADITDPATLPALQARFDVVVNVASSNKGGLEEYRTIYLNGTRNVLDWLEGSSPVLYLYTSSTSVYGQSDGSWVTEESPAQPESPTSQVLVQTEQELLRAFHHRGFPAMVLRVAGVYGPGRGHLFQQYLRGEAVMRESGESFINMIHLEDVAGAIAHLITHGQAGEIYNLVDDEPVSQRAFFTWLSDQLQRPLPPSAPADPARKRGLTNKRVSNDKLTTAAGYRCIYPTFRDGYSAEMRRLGLNRAS